MTGRLHGWVFDLDGTLTVAVHDFPAIKRELGLPPDQPILEAIAGRPESDRAAILARVHQWELGLAAAARPNPGARELLAHLRARGAPIGVLTRNSRDNALLTLDAAGLADLIPAEHVIGRDEAAPKPAPDGVLRLGAAWGLPAAALAMIGDYRFDLEAGRAAGARTAWLDVDRTGEFAALADRVVHDLRELVGWGDR